MPKMLNSDKSKSVRISENYAANSQISLEDIEKYWKIYYEKWYEKSLDSRSIFDKMLE